MKDKNDWIRKKFSGEKYEVTTDGRLFSNKTSGRRQLKTSIHPKTGYEQISMSDRDSGKSVLCLIHRIVAIVHLPNPHGLPMVNHKDGNKANNDVSNLEWCDCSNNAKHAYENNLRSATGENNGQSKLTEAQVIEIRKLRASGEKYKTLGAMFGIHPMTVGEICRREIWSHV